jgi:hypothetical protein
VKFVGNHGGARVFRSVPMQRSIFQNVGNFLCIRQRKSQTSTTNRRFVVLVVHDDRPLTLWSIARHPRQLELFVTAPRSTNHALMPYCCSSFSRRWDSFVCTFAVRSNSTLSERKHQRQDIRSSLSIIFHGAASHAMLTEFSYHIVESL